jgi:DNA-binding NarL/FixJ family response regulator
MTDHLVSILVVDGDASFRQTVCDLIGQTSDMTVVGTTSDTEEAVELVRSLAPDIVLLDADMLDTLGLEPVQEIGQVSPDSKVIILGIREQERLVLDALRKGAWGHLGKDRDGVDEMLEAIRVVHRGWTFLSPRMAGQVLDQVVYERRRATPSKGQRTDEWQMSA